MPTADDTEDTSAVSSFPKLRLAHEKVDPARGQSDVFLRPAVLDVHEKLPVPLATRERPCGTRIDAYAASIYVGGAEVALSYRRARVPGWLILVRERDVAPFAQLAHHVGGFASRSQVQEVVIEKVGQGISRVPFSRHRLQSFDRRAREDEHRMKCNPSV